MSELDWQRFLRQQGSSAVAPLRSLHGTWVEAVQVENIGFHTCVFEKAHGHRIIKSEQFTEDVMWAWGSTLAEFHEHTKIYTPSQGLFRRPPWTEHLSETIVGALTRDADSRETRRFQEITQVLKSLPRNQNSYGLVHTDLHNDNFLWSDGKLNVFDFDDCCEHWFSYDLAVPLFYLRFRNADSPDKIDLKAAEATYLRGYQSKIKDLSNQLDLLEMFVSYRKLIMYGWCQDQLSLNVLDQVGLDWCRNFLRWVRSEDV